MARFSRKEKAAIFNVSMLMTCEIVRNGDAKLGNDLKYYLSTIKPFMMLKSLHSFIT